MSKSTGEWTPDAALVREIEEQFESAIAAYSAKPTLITEHANHEESIRTGGYANRTLLELVQNAADAMAGSAPDVGPGRVEIVLDPTTSVLYCANSGRPFSKNGLIAITHAHLSGKRGDEIGRFGLGFKSVLAVTDSPQVLSRSVSFEFNSIKAQSAIKGIGSADRRLPALRTATLLDANRLFDKDPIAGNLAEWATTIVRLPGVEDTARIRREMETFTSEFLLFVSAVREVRLAVLGDRGFATSHVSRISGTADSRSSAPTERATNGSSMSGCMRPARQLDERSAKRSPATRSRSASRCPSDPAEPIRRRGPPVPRSANSGATSLCRTERRPKYFVVENVAEFKKSPQYRQFKEATSEDGMLADYGFQAEVLNAADFGAPQARRRTVIIGYRRDLGFPGFPEPSHSATPEVDGLTPYVTVRDALGRLPRVPDRDELFDRRRTQFGGREYAGVFSVRDLHWSRRYTDLSLKRFAVIPAGGNRRHLEPYPDLMARCWTKHKTGSGDVMGRLHWDRPSVTIRTEFFKPEKGATSIRRRIGRSLITRLRCYKGSLLSIDSWVRAPISHGRLGMRCRFLWEPRSGVSLHTCSDRHAPVIQAAECNLRCPDCPVSWVGGRLGSRPRVPTHVQTFPTSLWCRRTTPHPRRI